MTFKTELLQQTADMIKDAGYKVYISVWKHENGLVKPNYFHFTNGQKIGYCQEGYFGGIRFSTVHKPSAICGTGFGLQEDPGLYAPTIKDAEEAFIVKPKWFKKHFTPTKYESWDEYTKTSVFAPIFIEY